MKGEEMNVMKRIVSVLILLVLLAVMPNVFAEEVYDRMEMLVINVRKADCILLSYGDELYMIDTGSAESWGQVSRVLKTYGISHLTGVILTHTDADHAGGLTALSSSGIAIDRFYASCFYTCKENKHPAVLAAEKRGQKVNFLQAGDELPFGNGRLSVIAPLVRDEKENNDSLVLLAEGSGGKFLLAGDMEIPEEQTLLNAGTDLQADVLKVGNHGNDDAGSAAFVNAVSPRLAVISTNSADEPETPSARVLQLLTDAGAEIAETQKAEEGVLVVSRSGELYAEYTSFPELPEKAAGVTVNGKDQTNDSVTILNSGDKAVDLSGWYIFSERGGETFVFPDGSILEAGEEITVTSLSSKTAGDYVWQDKKIWHKSKEDCAVLYDVYGRIISYMY